MKRALILFALAFVWASAAAEPLPALSCACDPKGGGDLCSGFLVRFNDDGQAQIARASAQPKWSRWLQATATPEGLAIDADLIEPRLSFLTIDRQTGRYRAEWMEVGAFDFDGWTAGGVCLPMPAK